jgi:hypothetical protein
MLVGSKSMQHRSKILRELCGIVRPIFFFPVGLASSRSILRRRTFGFEARFLRNWTACKEVRDFVNIDDLLARQFNGDNEYRKTTRTTALDEVSRRCGKPAEREKPRRKRTRHDERNAVFDMQTA